MNFMTLSPTSYDGNAINDATNYKARFPLGVEVMAKSTAILSDRVDLQPLYSGKRLGAKSLTIVINTVAGNVGVLEKWFDTSIKAEKTLICTDSSDASTWYVSATCESMKVQPISTSGGGVVTVQLKVADPIWKNSTTTTTLENISATGETWTVTNSGSKFSRPVISIKPKAAKAGGFGYYRWLPIYNTSTSTLNSHPYNIFPTVLDHAALVTAVKAQADGDDMAIFLDGALRDYWFGGGGVNSTTLLMFTNLTLGPKIEGTTASAIAGAGAVSSITLANTPANISALQSATARKNKVLLIDNEAFTWSSISVPLLKVNGTVRAMRGTSAAAHSAGATIRFLEVDCWLAYGNTTATARTMDDTKKPMFGLTASTNTSWVYTDYYNIAQPNRSASWIPSVVVSANKTGPTPTNFYGADAYTNTNLAAIASEMGMSLKAYQKSGVWTADSNAEVQWRLDSNAGFSSVTTSSQKYRASASWPATAALQYFVGTAWTNVWNEATGTLSVWTAGTNTGAQSLGGTRTSIRYVLKGTVAASANNLAHWEVDTVTVVPVNVPTTAFLGAEGGTYELNCTLTNNTTGDALTVNLPMAVNETVTIDCDAKTAIDNAGVNVRGAVTFSSIRLDWMTVESGSNTMQYDETGAGNVDVTFAFKPRSP